MISKERSRLQARPERPLACQNWARAWNSAIKVSCQGWWFPATRCCSRYVGWGGVLSPRFGFCVQMKRQLKGLFSAW